MNPFDVIGKFFSSLFGNKIVAPLPAPNVSSVESIPESPSVVEAPAPAPPTIVTLATGSEFIRANLNLVGAVREANILQEFMKANMPNLLRNFIPISVSDGKNTIVYRVTPDFLCIGDDHDYVRMPMNPLTAQIVADKYNCSLITRKISNDIWKAAANKLEPKPWGPPYDADMQRTHRIGTHNATIQKQLVGRDPAALTSGHKKDVVLTNKLYPNNPNRKVAIYGWHQLNGQPIQGLNPSSHEITYEDYSHGVRLVSNDCVVNGVAMKIQDVFVHPVYSSLVSDEGPLRFLRY